MKKVITGIVLGILLFAIWAPAIAYADPGDDMDVDIVVVADEVDMNIDIYGDANVSVNNDGLATLSELQAYTSRTGSRGDLITWQAARRADKWIREIGQFLPDATAILILTSENHNAQLVVLTTQLEEHGLSISVNSDNITSLWGAIEAIDCRLTDTEEQIRAIEGWQIVIEGRWQATLYIAIAVLAIAMVTTITVWIVRRCR